jgi:hypothetical protein
MQVFSGFFDIFQRFLASKKREKTKFMGKALSLFGYDLG